MIRPIFSLFRTKIIVFGSNAFYANLTCKTPLKKLKLIENWPFEPFGYILEKKVQEEESLDSSEIVLNLVYGTETMTENRI